MYIVADFFKHALLYMECFKIVRLKHTFFEDECPYAKFELVETINDGQRHFV